MMFDKVFQWQRETSLEEEETCWINVLVFKLNRQDTLPKIWFLAWLFAGTLPLNITPASAGSTRVKAGRLGKIQQHVASLGKNMERNNK